MAEKTFNLQIISPTRVFFDEAVDMLEMKTTECEIGVLAGHIPLTTILEPGVLRIKTDGNVREAALHDGFVQIQKDKVTVLAESCEWPDEIDEKRAQKARERAERRLQHADDRINIARAELALKKSIIRLGLSQSGRKE